MAEFSAKIIVGFLFLVVGVNCAKFPDEFTRCAVGDTDCIAKTATTIARTVAEKKGFAGLNLLSIDPLHIDKIRIKQGAESPVNIELIFKDADLIGLKDIEFTKVSGFTSDPKGKYELHFKTKTLMLIGDYSIDGRVLILPIQGVGKCNLTLDNPTGILKFTGKSVTRNGKEYMQTDKLKFSFTTTRLHTYLGNLFKGDKALGDNTNLFLNENWEDIFNELKQNLFDAFGQIMESIINNAFNKVPYAEMFSN